MLCNDRFLGLKNKNNPLTSMLCLNKCRAYWVIDATEQVTNQDNKRLFADTRQPQICHVFPPVGNALNTILKDGRQKSHIKSYILKFSAFYASLTDLFFFFSLEFFFGYRLREGIQNCFPSRRCIPLTILEAVWHPWCILASEPPAGRTMARHSPLSVLEKLSAPPGTVKRDMAKTHTSGEFWRKRWWAFGEKGWWRIFPFMCHGSKHGLSDTVGRQKLGWQDNFSPVTLWQILAKVRIILFTASQVFTRSVPQSGNYGISLCESHLRSPKCEDLCMKN